MKKDIVKLQDSVTPETLGIFWFTGDPLKSMPRPFAALNYFLDGLLDHSPAVLESQRKNFFVSNNFGQNFFIAHLQQNSGQFKRDVEELMGLVQGLKRQQKKILILNFTSENYLEHLQKNYADFIFEQLQLD